MSLIECTAPRILAGQTNRCALQEQRAERKRLSHPEIHRAQASAHLEALFEKPFHLRMNREASRIARESRRDLSEPAGVDTCIYLVFGSITATLVTFPVMRQLSMHWLLCRFAGDRKRSIEFLSQLRDNRGSIQVFLLRVNLPERRMIFDPRIQTRLRNGRIVHFAVAMAAESDQIDNYVACELRAIISGNSGHADNSVRIFAVDVKNRDRLPLG